MRALVVLMGVCVALSVAGCSGGDDDPLVAKLLAGDHAGVIAAGGDGATARFAASVAHYFLGDLDAMNTARDAAFAGDPARAEVSAWIKANVDADATGAMAQFLRGVALELDHDPAAAMTRYAAAAAADPAEPRFGYCRAVADPEAKYDAVIPKEKLFLYKGTLLLDRNVWHPDPDDFEIVSGAVVTTLGSYTEEATFGDWTRLESETPGMQLGWSPLLTAGVLIMPPRVTFGNIGEDVIVTAPTSCAAEPFDYFGKYRRVVLAGDAARYPMIWVPYILRGRQWSSRGYLGEELRLSPDDVDDFVQVKYFDINHGMYISHVVNSPEKGLDFTWDLDGAERQGEFRFKEKAMMYRVAGEPPNDTIAVRTEGERLYWYENTSLGRKKVFEGTVWGPLRTLPVIRSGPLPTRGIRTVPPASAPTSAPATVTGG